MRKHTAIPLVLLSLVAVLLASGCGADREFASVADPIEGSSSQGVQFLRSPAAPMAIPLGETTTSKFIKQKDGGDVDVGKIKIKIPKYALPNDMTVTMTMVSLETMSFRVEPADLALSIPMEIEMDDIDKTDHRTSSGASIFRRVGNEHVRLDTIRDGNKAKAYSDGFGEYSIAEVNQSGEPVRFICYLSGPGYKTKFFRANDDGDVEYGRYKIKIPKNALAQDTFITVRDPGSGYLMCDLEPHGIVFLVPVELEMNIKDLALNPYTDWTIFWFNDADGIWEDQRARLDGDKLKANLGHFSRYGGGRAGW